MITSRFQPNFDCLRPYVTSTVGSTGNSAQSQIIMTYFELLSPHLTSILGYFECPIRGESSSTEYGYSDLGAISCLRGALPCVLLKHSQFCKLLKSEQIKLKKLKAMPDGSTSAASGLFLDRPESPSDDPIGSNPSQAYPEDQIGKRLTADQDTGPALPANPPPTPEPSLFPKGSEAQRTVRAATDSYVLPLSPPPSPPTDPTMTNQSSPFQLSAEVIASKLYASSIHGK